MLINENEIAHKVIGCAIEIHKTLGPGLNDSVYRECLCYELQKSDLLVERSIKIPLIYKDLDLKFDYTIDLIIEDKLIVELISADKVSDADMARMNKTLKLSNNNLGLIINFNTPLLKDGIRRVSLANKSQNEDRPYLEPQSENMPA